MLQAIYLHELLGLAKAIRDDCDAVFAEAPTPETGMYIKVAPILHARITAALLNAANVKKLVDTPAKHLTGESTKRWRWRVARSTALRDALGDLDLDEVLNTKVRNTIEHFAEYLDEASLDLETGPPPAPMAAYNMALSHWEATTPRVYPLKLYVACERKYYNMKYSVDLGRLRDQADTIMSRLLASGALSGIAEPGGLMVQLQTVAAQPNKDLKSTAANATMRRRQLKSHVGRGGS